jgi:peptide-methionine (S)-S-oxide reductase
LEIFFATHDPTDKSVRNDVGTQCSEIFYHNEEQKKKTAEVIGLMTAEDTWEANCYEDYQNFMKQKRLKLL